MSNKCQGLRGGEVKGERAFETEHYFKGIWFKVQSPAMGFLTREVR